MTFAVGSLIQARGREWVVLPESTDDLLVLRPLGGTEREVAGIYLPLEGQDVHPASFALPDPAHPGDFLSCRLLRDALHLGFRSSAGPFRSFARLNVEPRPYQLVPLLMALKLDPIRLMIADDVGIGKTIEAGLIARELLDRGEVQRLAVLCPPHLAEQWQAELEDKFHIKAELVLASTVNRLERNTAVGQSLFDLYPFVIASTEYIKSSRRRDEFVRTCPELVIVDEAHTFAFSAEQRGGRHLRHQLLHELAKSTTRHLVLVTATPHSGDEGAFRSLLGLLKPQFAHLPEDLTGPAGAPYRRAVAAHLVQRRRADIRDYLDAATPFPEREDAEETYTLGNEYKRLFTSALAYARERAQDSSGGGHRQRVRWWSALALLRSLGSSPAAAAATLRARSRTAEAESVEEADAVGERSVLDLDDVDAADYNDAAPGALEDGEDNGERPRLLELARRADALRGPTQDNKLRGAIDLVNGLLKEGYNPILFCRFIPTAEYVADELRQALPEGVEVAAVTGKLPPAERELRVRQLGAQPQRVLVATDCLSEGINLQNWFNAVVHYDLSWNPTRHEQREGRVDRYGQPSAKVRALAYYGTDNQIDGLVLDVLLRKHKTIRTSLGISVPVPGNTGELMQALVHGLLLRDPHATSAQLSLFDLSKDAHKDLHARWDNVADREQRSRTLFAQRSIAASEVHREWEAVRSATGTAADVERFVAEAVTAGGGSVTRKAGRLVAHLPNRAPLLEACGGVREFTARFELPVRNEELLLTRTHPLVEGLAAYVLETALDPALDGPARRCGAIRTRAVTGRTTLLLLRLRYHIVVQRHGQERALLAEDSRMLAFAGAPDKAGWLPPEQVEALLAAEPAGNIATQQASEFVRRLVESLPHLQDALNTAAEQRGQEILAAHQRVRSASGIKGVRYDVRAHLPPDLLGVYVLLPA